MALNECLTPSSLFRYCVQVTQSTFYPWYICIWSCVLRGFH